MTFLDSDTFRPLYDVSTGGKPCGFQCQLFEEDIRAHIEGRKCNRVTRTVRGMISHLWLKHQVRFQQEFSFEEAKPTKL